MYRKASSFPPLEVLYLNEILKKLSKRIDPELITKMSLILLLNSLRMFYYAIGYFQKLSKVN